MFGFGKEKEIPTFLGDARDIPAVAKKDKTLYDIQQQAARGIESDVAGGNEDQPQDIFEKHGVGEIEEKFDREVDAEKRKDLEERLYNTTHAFDNDNAKPKRTDYKGGEKIGNAEDLAA